MADYEISGESDNPKPIENKYQRGYNMKINRTGNSWITGMKIITWFVFFCIILAGLVVSFVFSDSIGMVIFIWFLSLILAFTSVATLMIYLNMATDISIIRQILQNKNE